MKIGITEASDSPHQTATIQFTPFFRARTSVPCLTDVLQMSEFCYISLIKDVQESV